MQDHRNAPARIGEVSPFDTIRHVTPEGREYWSARDLMPILGYERWERFADAIDRAKVSASNAGYDVATNFPGAAKITQTKPAVDFHLSRYACYLVALNGDPRKPEIAAAQTYFVIKTREAEVAAATPALPRTYAEALRAAADEADRADRAEAQVAELAPKADLADDYLLSQGGARLVREVAKVLDWKEKDLRRWLLEEKLIFVKHAPCGAVMYDFYAQYAHHFQTRERVVEHQWGSCTHYTLQVLPRGVELIHRRMNGRAA
ncbi:phage antirepressor KilAC domain-containing protein [Williamsia muralis]|uniref:phage antirepressor KilAC domain-containing protein n=1 Tax=Williamsia marianensis TaxID=85044 RepID=UPI003F5CE166